MVAAQTQAAVSFQRGDALEAAVASGKAAIVMLPADDNNVLLLQVRRNTSVLPERTEPVAFEATGFLGLTDEPIFDEEPQPKKKWWQRLLD